MSRQPTFPRGLHCGPSVRGARVRPRQDLELAMSKAMPTVCSFRARRARYETERSFDQVLAGLRAAVGDATRGELDEGARSSATKEDFESKMQRVAGDSGFMLFFELDHGAWLAKYGIHKKVKRWIFGNPVIAYTMLRHDITAGLFAPVELLLFESGPGATVIYDLPSSLMVIDDNPALLEAARALDSKFAALVERVT
jgi:uncharacterized protein (DUF302 family)